MDEQHDLAAYVPRVAREWLDSAHPDQRHRRIEGSMIFVDISGFTKLSERLARLGKIGAEGVTDVIATCFDRLLADAYEYDGSLLKFGGDALLLFYRGDAHVHRAAAAALAMRRTLRDVSRFDTDVGRVRLGMTVGLHTGSFDFFLVGGSHRELVITGPVTSELVATEAGATTGDIVVSTACAATLAAENIGDERAPGRLLRGRIATIRGDVEFYDTALELSGYVPRALAEAIRSRQSLESEHRQVTVAFLQFTGLDQRIRDGEAAAVAADLEQLMAIVQRAVDTRRLCFLSTDIATDGGKIILTAGAPSTTGNDEERMLLALREIIDAGPAIPLRIGVNAGPVFAGEIGTVHRRNYTVMGDPVNLAARVMARAEVGQILATSVVVDRSHTLFETTPLEPFNVKGKRQPVVACAVGSARAVRQQVAASGLPLVGRDTELATLDAAVTGARHGAGHCVEIVAEPGAGKTRLLQAFLERTDDFDVHRVGCRLYQVDSAYQSMSHLLGAALGLAGKSGAERAAELRQLVGSRCPGLLPWLSLIGVVLHLDIEESDEVRQLDATFRKSRLESSVAQLLGTVLTRPTVLCVEDAHWMDDASTGVMQVLADSAPARPWVVVVTRRAQGAPALDGVRHTRLELAPLDRRSAIDLIAAATTGYPLPRHVVEGMAERSDGNPLYLLELLNAVRNGGNLESMPTTVEALISARIDRLPPSERSTLRRASVLGVGFLAVHVAAVLPDADPTEALRRLTDFVTIDTAGWVSFRHALVRDVAYEGLPFATRRQLHGRVADSIRSAETDPFDQAALLSLHLLHAHRDVEAWQCSLLAADRARGVYANLDAAALYERALIAARRVGTIDAAQRSAVYESLGDVQDLAGLYREARQSYAMSRRLLRYDVSRNASVMLKEAYVAERQGRYSDSIRSVRRGLKLIDQQQDHDDERLRARLTTWEGAVRATQGRFRQALDSADRGIGLSTAVGDELNLARAYLIVDFAQINLGGAIGHGLAAAALEIYTRLGDLGGEANAANNLGGHYYYEGRWDEAAELYRQARRARDRMGDPVNSAFCAVNEAEILVEQGHLEQAIEALEEALTVLRAAADRSGVAFASQVLGLAKLRAGELDAGAELIASARDDYTAIGARSAALDTAVGLAEHLVLDSRPHEAIALIDALIDEQTAHGGHEPQMPAAHRLRGWALAELGDADAAESELRVGVATARQLGADHEIGLGLDALDALAAAFGKIPSTDANVERDEILGRLGVARRRDLRSIRHVNAR